MLVAAAAATVAACKQGRESGSQWRDDGEHRRRRLSLKPLTHSSLQRLSPTKVSAQCSRRTLAQARAPCAAPLASVPRDSLLHSTPRAPGVALPSPVTRSDERGRGREGRVLPPRNGPSRGASLTRSAEREGSHMWVQVMRSRWQERRRREKEREKEKEKEKEKEEREEGKVAQLSFPLPPG